MNKNKYSGQISLLFFDGVCVLCNRLIRFIHKNDDKSTIYFAHVSAILPEIIFQNQVWIRNEDSVIFLYKGKVYTKSNAIFKLIVSLGGIWKLIWVLRLVPIYFFNLTYKFIARFRYAFFGKFVQCPIPEKSLSEKIIFKHKS